MITTLIEAFLLGLAGGAVPGPILTGAFAEVLNFGFLKGIKIIFYALLLETLGALLILFIFYSIGFSDLVLKIISVLGAIVLFWFGSKIWQIKKIDTEGKQILSFPKILLLTALNSGYWIFWITIGVPKALTLDSEILGGKFIFLIIFELAWLVATLLLTFIFFQFRPLLQKRNLVGTTFKILASVLFLLGLKTLVGIF